MKPIFIGGTGRSGTTVLKRVLSCHSQVVSLPFELRIVVDPGGILDLVAALTEFWSPFNADIAIHRFKRLMLASARTSLAHRIEHHLLNRLGISSRRYSQLGLAQIFGHDFYFASLNKLIEELCYGISRGSWTGSYPYQLNPIIYETRPHHTEEISPIVIRFFDGLFQELAKREHKHEASWWVDDTPYSFLHADKLVDIFPSMRLLHIYRDPRDVLASYLTKTWGGKDVRTTAQRLSAIMYRWFHIRSNLPTNIYHEVKLETLAENPDIELRTICQFLGVDFQPGLLRIQLSQTNAERWKTDLTSEQLTEIGQYLNPIVETLGYDLSQ
jgi:hypothetical protein